MSCIAPGCLERYSARNFCTYHLTQFYRGWLTNDGEKTELWRGNPYHRLTSCRYPACLKSGSLRKGLCLKHYKWLARGYMNEDCEVLIKVKEKLGKAPCKIPNCEKLSRRNRMCCFHDRQVKQGIIFEDGSRNTEVRPYKKVGCKVCSKIEGIFVKGFCKKHYGDMRKGILDQEGNELRELKRIAKYKDSLYCKAKSCSNKPRGRGFCTRHLAQWSAGNINDRGVPQKPMPWYNRGQICRAIRCKDPAHCKGYCKKHYSRSKRGFLEIEDSPFSKKINTPCIVEDCPEKKHCRNMCLKHYNIWRKIFLKKPSASKMPEQRAI